MSDIVYQEEWFDEVVEDIKPLIENHWEEIALNKEKIKLNPDWEIYEALNDIDRLRIFTVRDDGRLVGYNILIINKHLHYKDHVFAVNDLIFIDEAYRGRTVAYRLIKYVEKMLKESGVSVMVMNMKVKSPFDKLLEGCGFTYVERIYSKYIGE